MVNTTAKKPGLNDWWIQRISASCISLFVLPMLVLWLGGWLNQADDWYAFLASVPGKALTLLGIIGFLLHARIGLWVVITDYAPKRFQGLAIGLMTLYLLAVVFWAVYLVWIIS